MNTTQQIVARLQETHHLEAASANPKQDEKAVQFFTEVFGSQPKPCSINTPNGTQRRDDDGVCWSGVKLGSVKCKITLANLHIYIEPEGSSAAAKDVKEMYKGLLEDTFTSGSRAISGFSTARDLVKSFARDANTCWNGYSSKYNSDEYVAKYYRAGERPRDTGNDKKNFDQGIADTLKKWSKLKL